jgi:hypothetical protein
MIGMIPPTLSISGTLGWAVTDLNVTTATLNVTRDITTSSWIVTPIRHHTGSFNESINLATRIASILPFIEPEVDQALQEAQTSMALNMPTGTDWSSTMSAIDATMMHQPVHTMWWVNGPLKLNDTVPVLVFATNVTRSTGVDVGGSIGSRSAWTLSFPKTGSPLPPDPLATMTSSIPIANNFEFVLTFNYDKVSDLLLSASANIHLGFGVETIIQPTPCNASATVACPASSPMSVMREFGIDARASLKLAGTTLDLSQRLTPTGGSESSSGSSSGSAGTGTRNGQGSGAGSAPGSNSGSNSGSGSGYDPGSGSTTTGAGQPANPAQSKPSTHSAVLLPWMYGILGVIAAAIIASDVWIVCSQLKKEVYASNNTRLSRLPFQGRRFPPSKEYHPEK